MQFHGSSQMEHFQAVAEEINTANTRSPDKPLIHAETCAVCKSPMWLLPQDYSRNVKYGFPMLCPRESCKKVHRRSREKGLRISKVLAGAND